MKPQRLGDNPLSPQNKNDGLRVTALCIFNISGFSKKVSPNHHSCCFKHDAQVSFYLKNKLCTFNFCWLPEILSNTDSACVMHRPKKDCYSAPDGELARASVAHPPQSLQNLSLPVWVPAHPGNRGLRKSLCECFANTSQRETSKPSHTDG